jgi:hypothetical protein
MSKKILPYIRLALVKPAKDKHTQWTFFAFEPLSCSPAQTLYNLIWKHQSLFRTRVDVRTGSFLLSFTTTFLFIPSIIQQFQFWSDYTPLQCLCKAVYNETSNRLLVDYRTAYTAVTLQFHIKVLGKDCHKGHKYVERKRITKNSKVFNTPCTYN